MKFLRLHILIGIIGFVSSANASTWQEGTVYFNDESTVDGEISMGTSITINYENENVKIPYEYIKSIELLSVKKGSYQKTPKAYAPTTLLNFKLRNEATVKAEVNTYFYDFCNGKHNFVVRRINPLTRVSEEKSYNWVGHRKASNQGNCVFTDNPGDEKKVLKHCCLINSQQG